MGNIKKAALWYSAAAVGAHIGVSKQTIIREIKRGKITATRTPGGHYRIRYDEVLRCVGGKI